MSIITVKTIMTNKPHSELAMPQNINNNYKTTNRSQN